MKILIFIVLNLLISSFAFSQTWQSNKAKLESNGCLSYEEDANKNRIPDFSYAGYKGGGLDIPNITVKQTISPVSGDNTSNIQDAIDAVSLLTPDANGFRGAVLLQPGRYPVNGQIFIHTSGVVLRGTSDGRDSQDTTIIYGVANTPAQRDLIILGGGIETQWRGEVSNSRQDITTDFVQVGSHTFEIVDASSYTVGDNIIIYHPCSAAWLNAIDNGGTGSDPSWSENQFPIIYNRYIKAISGNEITINAPVYNHLDKSLSQSYVYKYDRDGLVTNIGIENLRVEIESLGGDDENHVWNAIQFTQVEDAWARNATVTGFGLSGIRTATASRISVINVHSLDPVAIMTGGRMYNFNSYVCSNNILFDNCYARNGRHHYVSNGVGTVSGFVVLRSVSENPNSGSEGHRHWTTGMLFDNLIDIGTYPTNGYSMAFYNRGDYGNGHGWSAAHSVFWNCEANRPGKDAAIIVEQPPTAQNYAIGCKGALSVNGPFCKTKGYIEGANNSNQLEPISLYEAQLLCRTDYVLSDFKASKTAGAINELITFSAEAQGNISSYSWDFGQDAVPSNISGIGPHQVEYTTEGLKTVTLIVSNGNETHSETKTAYINISNENLYAHKDVETITKNDSVTTSILVNDSYPIDAENYSYVFDGINDKIVYDDATLLNQYPFTMMAWVKTSSNSGQTILYLGNPNSGVTGNSLSIRSGKTTLEAWTYNGSTTKENITDVNDINDGLWHHIAGVFTSPTERHLYVDGVLVGSDNIELDNLTTQNLSKFSVGNRDDSSPNDWFQGDLDEIRMYTSALSEFHIKDIMKGQYCGMSEKLLYWNFDNQTSTIVPDEFNYFNGTTSGGTSTISQIKLDSLNALISIQPKNGTAYFSSDFEITYKPSPNFYGLDSLTYKLSVGECDSSLATIVYQIDEITGVKEIPTNSSFVYPNPTQGVVQLNIEGIKDIKLYSSTGRLLEKLPQKNECNISDLDNGIYILIIEALTGELTSHKILKH